MSFCSETNRFISKPVVAVRCNGKKDVYTYTTVSGRRIHCTDNHPVLTTEGWQPIKIAKNIATTKTRTGNYFFETIKNKTCITISKKLSSIEKEKLVF